MKQMKLHACGIVILFAFARYDVESSPSKLPVCRPGWIRELVSFVVSLGLLPAAADILLLEEAFLILVVGLFSKISSSSSTSFLSRCRIGTASSTSSAEL